MTRLTFLFVLALSLGSVAAFASVPKFYNGQFYLSTCVDDADIRYTNHTDTGSPRVGISLDDRSTGLRTGAFPIEINENNHPGLMFLMRGDEGSGNRSTGGTSSKSTAYNISNGHADAWATGTIDGSESTGRSYPETLPYISTRYNTMTLNGSCPYVHTHYGPTNNWNGSAVKIWDRGDSKVKGANLARTGYVHSDDWYCDGSDPVVWINNHGHQTACPGTTSMILYDNGGGGTTFSYPFATDGTTDKGCDSAELVMFNCEGDEWIASYARDDNFYEHYGFDGTVNNNSGTYSDSTNDTGTCRMPYRTSARIGNGWHFDGADHQFLSKDDLSDGAGGSVNLGGSLDFSYSAWVKVDTINSGYNAFMGQGSGSREAYLGIDSASGKFMFWVNGQGILANSAVNTGQWYHVSGVFHSATAFDTAYMRLYVDGRRQTSTNTSTWAGPNTRFRLGSTNSGASETHGGGANWFSGTIDEVVVVGYAQGDEEVAANYNPTMFKYSALGYDALDNSSTWAFGPDYSTIYYNGYTPPSGPYGSIDGQVLQSVNMPFKVGGENYVQFVAQNTDDYTTVTPRYQVTINTPAPETPSVSGSGISTSQVRWDWSNSYICNPHDFQAFTTVSPQTLDYNGLDVYPQPSAGTYTQSSLGVNVPAGLAVRSHTMYGYSTLSSVTTAYTLANPPNTVAAPTVNFTSMTVTWSRNGDPTYTPFELSMSTNDPSFGPVATSTPITLGSVFTGITQGLTGLAHSTTYYYRVRAANGNGGYPGGGQTTLFSSQVETLNPIPTLAVAPDPVTAAGNAFDSVRFDWPHVPTVQSYNLYTAEGTLLCSWVPRFFDYGPDHASCAGLAAQPLGPNQRAGLKVQVVNLSGAGNIREVPVYAFSLARPPLTLSVVSLASNTVTLGWSNNSNPGYTTYQVNASLDAAFSPGLTSTLTVVGQTASLSGLLPGSTYYYRVRALNGDGVASVYATLGASPTPIPNTQSQTRVGAGSAATISGVDNRTQVLVPAGALPGGATVFVSVDPAAEPVIADKVRVTRTLDLAPEAGMAYAPGTAREFIALINNAVTTAPFTSPVTLVLPYTDNIHPGFLDDSDPPILVGSLRAYTLNNYLDVWEPVTSTLDLASRTVRATTNHFSVYALFGKPLATASDLTQVKAYPQPWKPGTGGRFDSLTRNSKTGMVFENVPAGTTLKIYTLNGELVRTLNSETESATCACEVVVWDGKNSSGKAVASAVYIARLEGGGKEKIMKVAIER